MAEALTQLRAAYPRLEPLVPHLAVAMNGELVALVELDQDDEERLLRLLERHQRATGSVRAAALLADPVAALRRFRCLLPKTAATDSRIKVKQTA